MALASELDDLDEAAEMGWRVRVRSPEEMTVVVLVVTVVNDLHFG